MKKLGLLLLGGLLCLASTSHGAGYTQTKYPIVLVHGMFGWDKALSLIDYFYKIPRDLERSGAKVFLARVSGLDSPETRGEQLLKQVEDILAISGYDKVNIIGHSQGSPTARYVASVRPDLVASVVSAHGANGGSPVADLLYNRAENGTIDAKILEKLANAINDLINLVSDKKSPIPADFNESIRTLTTKESEKFNKKYPTAYWEGCAKGKASLASNGVHYFSFGGTDPFTNLLDPSDYFLWASHKISFREGSDGLVGKCANHLGQVIRDDYAMNHIDAMNHLFGVRGTNPRAVYRQVANRLKNIGL